MGWDLKSGMMAVYGCDGLVDETLYLYGFIDIGLDGGRFMDRYERKVGDFGDLDPLQQRALNCRATIKSIVPAIGERKRSKKGRKKANGFMWVIEERFKQADVDKDQVEIQGQNLDKGKKKNCRDGCTKNVCVGHWSVNVDTWDQPR